MAYSWEVLKPKLITVRNRSQPLRTIKSTSDWLSIAYKLFRRHFLIFSDKLFDKNICITHSWGLMKPKIIFVRNRSQRLRTVKPTFD